MSQACYCGNCYGCLMAHAAGEQDERDQVAEHDAEQLEIAAELECHVDDEGRLLGPTTPPGWDQRDWDAYINGRDGERNGA